LFPVVINTIAPRMTQLQPSHPEQLASRMEFRSTFHSLVYPCVLNFWSFTCIHQTKSIPCIPYPMWLSLLPMKASHTMTNCNYWKSARHIVGAKVPIWVRPIHPLPFKLSPWPWVGLYYCENLYRIHSTFLENNFISMCPNFIHYSNPHFFPNLITFPS